MPSILQGGKVIEGSGLNAPLLNAGAPSNGTDEIQTITFGGTPIVAPFRLKFDGFTTSDINWSATNNTLRDNVDAALEALPSVGTGGVATAVGTMTAGVGTLTATFSGGNLTKKLLTVMTVPLNNTTGTIAVTQTTPGVDATGRGCAVGAKLIDTTNAFDYINTGTSLAPTWTKTGTQS